MAARRHEMHVGARSLRQQCREARPARRRGYAIIGGHQHAGEPARAIGVFHELRLPQQLRRELLDELDASFGH